MEKESRKRKAGVSGFTCASLCAPVCCSPGKARAGTALSPRRCACNPTKPRMMPSVAMNICILIHSPPRLAFADPRGARKTASFRQKTPRFRPKVPRFRALVREKLAAVSTLGRNHALRRSKMRGGKSWRAGKKTVSLRRYAAHATFLLRRPAVSHSARSPSARAGTRPATARALLRAPRVAPSTPTFHPIFLPQQQLFSC